ncbi:hypothetical protein THH46_14845 [Pseudomonas sp. NA13]
MDLRVIGVLWLGIDGNQAVPGINRFTHQNIAFDQDRVTIPGSS